MKYFVPLLLFWLLCGCPQESAENMVTGAAESPAIVRVETTSSRSVDITFSEPVEVTHLSATESLGETAAEQDNDTLCITFAGDMMPGTEYEVRGTVVNAGESSLDFTVPFTGFNGMVPDITLNEVRCTRNKEKVEYIELYAATAGNLAGLTVYCASSSREHAYTFPAADVPAGSFIVLHMRNLDNAYTDDVASPDSGNGNAEATDSAYNFWLGTEKKVLHQTDVILLERSNGGKIIDSLLMCAGNKTAWGNANLEKAAAAAVAAGKWQPDATVAGAAKTSDGAGKNGITLTRTLGKTAEDAPGGIAGNWRICPTSKASQGRKNWQPE